MSFTLDYDWLILLDAESLAEAGIGKAYSELLPALQKYVRQTVQIEEFIDDETPSYSVKSKGREFLIHGPEVDDKEGDSWGRATFAFFAIVNDQLVNSDYRFYAINGGNDLGGMFLTPEQANASQATLASKRDWPYLPDNAPPWYGEHH